VQSKGVNTTKTKNSVIFKNNHDSYIIRIFTTIFAFLLFHSSGVEGDLFFIVKGGKRLPPFFLCQNHSKNKKTNSPQKDSKAFSKVFNKVFSKAFNDIAVIY